MIRGTGTGRPSAGAPPGDASRSLPLPWQPLSRGDLLIGAALSVGLLGLYLVTLCPTIYVEDAAEFTTAAAVLGVAHPPGYPLYTMLAAAFVRAVPVGEVAYRSNLFSATCAALTAGCLWWLLRRLAVGRLAAVTAAICFGLGATFWSLALVAEVHALNCLLLVLTVIGAGHAAAGLGATPGRAPAGPRTTAAFGAAAGLLVGHRNLNLLFVVCLVVWLELTRRRLRRPAPAWLWTYAAAAALATGLVYLYLPLAARRAPILNTGDPSTASRLMDMVTARAYFRHLGTGNLDTELGRALTFLAHLPAELGVTVLAVPVAVLTWWRKATALPPAPLAPLTAIAVTCVGFSSLYNVMDVEAYFLPAVLSLAVIGAWGLDMLPPALRRGLPLLALLMLPIHFRAHDLREVRAADRYGRDLLQSAPPRAVVIAIGDTSRNVMTYRQGVLHERTDVALAGIEQISPTSLAQLRARHPQVDWPDANGGGLEWLSTLVDRNAHQRAVCLTLPLKVGLTAWQALPQGLLSCFRRRDQVTSLAGSVAWWGTSAPPTLQELVIPDVHLHMVALSYAAARFALARSLAQGGELEQARAQLGALARLEPDRSESLVHRAKNSVGAHSRRFSYGARARRALGVSGPDGAAFLAALDAEEAP